MIERGGNGFADLGLPDADGYLLLAELVTRLDKIIRELGLKQLEAAKLLRLELANRWRDRWTRRRRFWMCFLVAGMIVGGLGRLVPDRTVFGATLRTTPMITTNVLFRVFHIAWGDSTGTAFTIDHASKQYLCQGRSKSVPAWRQVSHLVCEEGGPWAPFLGCGLTPLGRSLEALLVCLSAVSYFA